MKVAVRRRVQAHGLNLERGSVVEIEDALGARLVREGAAVAPEWPAVACGIRRKRPEKQAGEEMQHGRR